MCSCLVEATAEIARRSIDCRQAAAQFCSAATAYHSAFTAWQQTQRTTAPTTVARQCRLPQLGLFRCPCFAGRKCLECADARHRQLCGSHHSRSCYSALHDNHSHGLQLCESTSFGSCPRWRGACVGVVCVGGWGGGGGGGGLRLLFGGTIAHHTFACSSSPPPRACRPPVGGVLRGSNTNTLNGHPPPRATHRGSWR